MGPVASLKRFLHDAEVIGRMSDPVVKTERLRGLKQHQKDVRYYVQVIALMAHPHERYNAADVTRQ